VVVGHPRPASLTGALAAAYAAGARRAGALVELLELAALEFAEPELDSLHQGILCWYAERGHLDPGGLSNHLCETGFAGLVKRLVVPGPQTAWFCQDGTAKGAVLEGWRACIAQHRRHAERRAMADAASAAMAEQRADAGAHVLAVNRLINPVDLAGASRPPRALGKPPEDLGE